MTTPSDPDSDKPTEAVNLAKGEPTSDAPFDPYRFGRPDHPIAAEYAPPGYTGPTVPAGSPYSQQPNPWAAPQPPPGTEPNPFNNPPGTPYPPAGAPYNPQQQQPYQYPPPGTVVGQGAPPPPAYHQYVQPGTGNGKSVAALVLGILSIVLCWLSLFDAIFVILGLIFSLIALNETKRRPGMPGRGMAIAGLICTIIGAILATVLTVVLIHAANKCGGFSNSSDSNFNQCVRDNF
jgi:VanZ family protein